MSETNTCHDWTTACLSDQRSQATCKTSLDAICQEQDSEAGCFAEVCHSVPPEDTKAVISSWCNSCTADSCYDWRVQCEIDPQSESCNAALELVCKHHNDSCRKSVCEEYDGPEETKAVLRPWCNKYNSKCKPVSIVKKKENVAEDHEDHEAAGLGLGLAIVLTAGAYAGRKQIFNTAQSFRRGVGRWWVPEYDTNLSLDGNGKLVYSRNTGPEEPTIYDNPDAVYPNRNRWQMHMDSAAAQQRLQDAADAMAQQQAFRDNTQAALAATDGFDDITRVTNPEFGPPQDHLADWPSQVDSGGYTMAPDGNSVVNLTNSDTDRDETGGELTGAE